MNNKIRIFPASQWLSQYSKDIFVSDLTAGIIVTVLLIPQSLAYAMLAGVPAEVGLYSSIFPLLFYAFFGTSRTLSVGPVAVVSLMTATTLGAISEQGSASYLTGAMTLALLSGVFLLTMGFLKLGFITNFLSHAVISGFISASAIIIALSQVKHVLGITAHGDTLTEIIPTLLDTIKDTNIITLIIGTSVLIFLVFSKEFSVVLFTSLKIEKQRAITLSKILPIASVILSIIAAFTLNLEQYSVAVTGVIPSGLPSVTIAIPSYELIKALALPAFLISIIGYVESISVGKTLAAKRRQKVDANQELIGLGAANIASSISGGFPVTGGFSRSVVNFDAGAVTQAASIFAAIGIAIASVFLTPVLYYLPKATLAATIIVAVISLIDFSILKKTFRYSMSDFYAILVTVLITLFFGVEIGVASGVLLSIGLHLYQTSTPHIAEIGLIAGSEHFRNINRYVTQTDPTLLMLRPDESLFFPNAAFLEQKIQASVYQKDSITHVILLCSAVNDIDYSALEVLESLNKELYKQGVKLHLSEIKGPVMDKLSNSTFLEHLHGNIYISHIEAFNALKSE
ncbi:SulP family inorganic anion transporter [Marinagarivorans algicola]|uniref:SulP family inorganic anion transporter n=1 Tax=Marinagarivorans algicola TaxID=1513270 RepID=UPI0006B91202|nr:sulfate permease [Marinagarivorans algicola]